MGRIATAVTATRNALGSPVVVRSLKSFVTNLHAFEPGGFYRIAAGDAADWIRAGNCRAVTDADELAKAEYEISSRHEVD